MLAFIVKLRISLTHFRLTNLAVSTGVLRRQHLPNILQALIIKCQLVLGAPRALKQAADSFACSTLLACCQCIHGRSDQDELLLQEVEADDGIDAVPILQLRG